MPWWAFKYIFENINVKLVQLILCSCRHRHIYFFKNINKAIDLQFLLSRVIHSTICNLIRGKQVYIFYCRYRRQRSARGEVNMSMSWRVQRRPSQLSQRLWSTSTNSVVCLKLAILLFFYFSSKFSVTSFYSSYQPNILNVLFNNDCSRINSWISLTSIVLF